MKTNEVKKGGCLRDTRGLATVEYVLIACLIAIVSFGAFKALGSSVQGRVEAATAAIAQLPSDSDAGEWGSSMGSSAMRGLGGGGGEGGCAAHAAAGGGAGAPCDPASFGSCVGGGSSTVVISCDSATGLTTASTP